MNQRNTTYEDMLDAIVRIAGLPDPVREFKFHQRRRWRFDLAWPGRKIAAEVEGGIWHGGRHVRGGGYEADCEKYNAAVLEGWRVVRFTTGMIESGAALETLERLLS